MSPSVPTNCNYKEGLDDALAAGAKGADTGGSQGEHREGDEQDTPRRAAAHDVFPSLSWRLTICVQRSKSAAFKSSPE